MEFSIRIWTLIGAGGPIYGSNLRTDGLDEAVNAFIEESRGLFGK
jgi:hypothetical protein